MVPRKSFASQNRSAWTTHKPAMGQRARDVRGGFIRWQLSALRGFRKHVLQPLHPFRAP